MVIIHKCKQYPRHIVLYQNRVPVQFVQFVKYCPAFSVKVLIVNNLQL